jgi:hypothetical protein
MPSRITDVHKAILAQRIAAEHRKYGNLPNDEWAEIAASKVVAQLGGWDRLAGSPQPTSSSSTHLTTTLHHPSVPEATWRECIADGLPELLVTRCCNAGHQVPPLGHAG